MSDAMDRAVESAALELAVVKAQGLWGKLNDREREVVLTAARGQVRLVLAAALPPLAEFIGEFFGASLVATFLRDSASAVQP